MKKYAISGIIGLLFLSSAALVNGQGFTGPDSGSNYNTHGQAVMVSSVISVNEARNLPHDSWVMLTGNIINLLPGGRHYTFRDAGGEIAVDIGPKEWRGLSVGPSDRVKLYGEVKRTRGQISIKVHAIEKLQG